MSEYKLTCKCKARMYGYTDGNHDVFICFKCGRFDGISNNDPEFLEDIKENPVIILEMISDKILIPVK